MTELAVGVIGLGKMGGTLADRLVAEDHTVYGYDVDETALDAAVDGGIVPTDSIPGLVSQSQIVLSSLPDPDAVNAVYLGDDGIVDTAESGLIALETSTIDPETTRGIAESAADADVSVLDAPVSGGIGRAERGTLTVMVGGERTTFEDPRVQSVLESFGEDVVYGGEVGAGHTLKLLNNMISAATAAAALEGAALAAEVGVDWEAFLDVVGTSSGSSYGFRKQVPRALNRDFEATFTLAMGLKDSRLARDMAESVDFPTPMADAMHQIRTAGVKKGYGDEGSQAIVKVFEEFATRRVRHPDDIDEDYLSWADKE
jgi:3-hydroxyisobutyrate dehydrogenase-like beta-hydroxyacid dehydrogenase